MAIQNLALKIEGMHCHACATGIQMVTENVRGVQGVIVSFEKTCGDWKFDDDIVSEEKIIKEITSLGYKVELSNDKKN